MHYFYGARSLSEVFYLEDFLEIEKEYPNFHFHLALDRPDPAADAAGVKYTAGFVAPVLRDTRTSILAELENGKLNIKELEICNINKLENPESEAPTTE